MIARLFSDETGASHFEDLDLLAPEREGWASAAAALASAEIPAAAMVFRTVTIEATSEQWHRPPRRLIAVQMAGEVEVEASDGEIRRMGPGSALFVEDTHGQGHLTRGVGPGPRTALYIYLAPSQEEPLN